MCLLPEIEFAQNWQAGTFLGGLTILRDEEKKILRFLSLGNPMSPTDIQSLDGGCQHVGILTTLKWAGTKPKEAGAMTTAASGLGN